jgi:cysteinyl-tRNA synthetase
MGHARSYVTFDVVRRYLEAKGYAVTYVQNFTDVDDMIIKRAEEAGENPLSFSEKYIQEYFVDIDKLGVRRANFYPKVSEHIPEIIEVIKVLIRKGLAYVVNGDVYFAVAGQESFGRLTHQPLEEVAVNGLERQDEKRRNLLDFILWKSTRRGGFSWDSPWGRGRPGWHVECSAMSMKYLGSVFDIHGGGKDLIFPHHESEILIAEAYSGKEFAKYYLHNGFITLGKVKMSKSSGKFMTLREVFEKYSPKAVRFFLLQTHYRDTIEYNDEKLREADRSLKKIQETVRKIESLIKDSTLIIEDLEKETYSQIQSFRTKFYEAMDNDFDTPTAIQVVIEFTEAVNSLINATKMIGKNILEKILVTYHEFGTILGLF